MHVPAESQPTRRRNPSVPFNAPDWLVLHELAADVRRGITQHARGRILDVGCGERPFQAWAPQGTTWIGLDVESNPRAEIHGTAENIPLDDGSVDTVLCTQVLEHVRRPWKAIAELHRVLKHDGILIASVPQYWPLHEEPHDYFRFTVFGLRSLMEDNGFEIVEMRGEGRGGVVAAQAFNNAVLTLGEGSIGRLRVVRALKRVVFTIANIIGIALSKVMNSEHELLNHFVVAKKTRG